MDGFALVAYLEPGTGSLILQVLVAMLAGSLYAIRLGWTRIKSSVGRMMGFKASNSSTTDQSGTESADQVKRDIAA